MKRLLLAAAAIAAACPALAQNSEPADSSVFFMGGRMASSDFGEMFNPVAATYEEAIVLGVGVQHYFAEPVDQLRLGVEVGAAVRTGTTTTNEIWGGGVARYDGFVLNDSVRISPSLTFGASVVSDTMGKEAEREAEDKLPGDVLFYLSPEIAISSTQNPDSEVFVRLHHRSGAWNTFGGGGSANATMLGVRTSF